MGGKDVSAALRRFECGAPCQVLCGACGLFFLVARPAMGDRIECIECGEIVQLDGIVARKRHVASSRSLIASWLDQRGSAASEMVFRVVLSAALVAASAAALASNCSTPERVEALHATDPVLDEPPPPGAADE